MPFFVYQYMSTLSLHSQKAAKAHKAALDMINALSTNRVRTSSRNLGLRIVMLYFSKFFSYGLIFLIFVCTAMGYIHRLGTCLTTPHSVSMC